MHFYLLAVLCFFQSFAFAQKGPETEWPPATKIVYKSIDGGQTWQDVSTNLPGIITIESVYADGSDVFLCTENGLYRSNTASAMPAWENLDSPDKKITEIFPGRDGPYACSYGNGFFQEIPGKGVWIPKHNALQDKSVCSVLETSEGTLFVGCYTGIFKSVDHGKSWKQVFEGGRVTSLVSDDGVLIGSSFKGVLRSVDGGEHWDWAMTDAGAAFRTVLIEGGVAAITFDGGINQTRTSFDHGKTWQALDESLPKNQFLFDIKRSGKYLFSSQETGVFRSSDGGKTWKLVLPSSGKRMFNLAVSGQVVYAVLLASGC